MCFGHMLVNLGQGLSSLDRMWAESRLRSYLLTSVFNNPDKCGNRWDRRGNFVGCGMLGEQLLDNFR